MDATNKNSSGKIGRKFGSAMKALRDFDVLKDWIWEQVRDLPPPLCLPFISLDSPRGMTPDL
jgi:hypothetical protein